MCPGISSGTLSSLSFETFPPRKQHKSFETGKFSRETGI